MKTAITTRPICGPAFVGQCRHSGADIRSETSCVANDPIDEKLDELADLALYWKKNRDLHRNPRGIRQAMLQVITEIHSKGCMEPKSGSVEKENANDA